MLKDGFAMNCTRRLEFDAAHRLVEHAGLCAHLHGHRYAVEVTCTGPLDSIGCIIDFGAIKAKLGGWLAERWDHAALLNRADVALIDLCKAEGWRHYLLDANPTAEYLAEHLLGVATSLLAPIRVVRLRMYETPNCWAEVHAS
jgi:6-pyruvoyltetrahydropterin/6-carboxytetrahydropterin synthase